MKPLLFVILLLSLGMGFCADPTYNNDKLQTFDKTAPTDSEPANTIGAWARNTRGALYDAYMTEHTTTGTHTKLTIFGATIHTTTNYVLNSTNASKFVTFSGTNTIAITLPLVSAVGQGRFFCFKRIDNNTNTITLNRSGTDVIDGVTSMSLTNGWQTLWLAADGTTNYYAVGQPTVVPTLTQRVKACVNFDGRTKVMSQLSQLNGTATATFTTPHGISDGDIIEVTGATYSGYNGFFTASGCTTYTVNYPVAGATASPDTGSSHSVVSIVRNAYNVVRVSRPYPGSGIYAIHYATFMANTNSTISITAMPTDFANVWITTPMLIVRATSYCMFALHSLRYTQPFAAGSSLQYVGTNEVSDVNVVISDP